MGVSDAENLARLRDAVRFSLDAAAAHDLSFYHRNGEGGVARAAWARARGASLAPPARVAERRAAAEGAVYERRALEARRRLASTWRVRRARGRVAPISDEPSTTTNKTFWHPPRRAGRVPGTAGEISTPEPRAPR